MGIFIILPFGVGSVKLDERCLSLSPGALLCHVANGMLWGSEPTFPSLPDDFEALKSCWEVCFGCWREAPEHLALSLRDRLGEHRAG
jgi:hypothetical protein